MNDNNVPKTDEEFKQRLDDDQYKVMRMGATEPPFTGKYVNNKKDGMYHCAACGAALFSSTAKFESGTGWPSFTDPAVAANVETEIDDSLGMIRTEVKCKNCGSHLGHLFEDGP